MKAISRLACVMAIAVLTAFGISRAVPRSSKTVQQRMTQYSATVKARLLSDFRRVGSSYPPHEVSLLAFKDSNVMEVYVRALRKEEWQYLRNYPILAASGRLGPKLREGDSQVPEGIYSVESLNPNSRFHLALRVGYPNGHDRRVANIDGRTNLGGDIMIHGSNVSIGCLAMGDRAAEDLFVLAGHAGVKNVTVLISPTDFRLRTQTLVPSSPRWVTQLYADLRKALNRYPISSN